ncbi:MoxR family ATPase [bacterium]|nr:MoxR family ATPase [bacterium]MCI0605979.1 MoxR family ATPase [bacterium]
MNADELQNLIQEKSVHVTALQNEFKNVIVGQRYLMQRLLISLLSDGHVLVEGLPGLAKTLAVKSVSQAIQADFKRIQFTPDLLPSDLTGTLVFNPKDGSFVVKKGPIFCNILLADEINRAPAKVQSALLEAMQERQVTIGEESYPLEEPFLVFATQNPIEHEGTYPLPEAQIDRFMMKVKISYPSKDEEKIILDRMTGTNHYQVKSVLDKEHVLMLRDLAKEIFVEDSLKNYIVQLVSATRSPKDYHLEIGRYIQYGVSPRAAIFWTMAAKAHAFLQQRSFVIPDDIKLVAPDILRHRIIRTYEADAENVSTEDLIQQILVRIPIP